MAIRPLLAYKNPDSTRDLNNSQARIIDRAIFDGGSLTLSGTSFQVDVAPFIASGFDGMVAVSDTVTSLTVPNSGGGTVVSYLVLHLEYRTLTPPIVNLQMVTEATWNSSVSRNYFVTFAKFTIPASATALTDPGVLVDYSVGDWADKLGKTGWRSPVANLASLPLVGNRDGDVRIVLDTNTVYVWDAGTETWDISGGAVSLASATAVNHEVEAQILRDIAGSGILGSVSTHGRSPGGPLITSSGEVSIAHTGGTQNVSLHPFSAVVNGHYLKLPSQSVNFDSPPAATHYELVYLEVWREEISDPDSETYPSSASGALSLSSVQYRLENLISSKDRNIGISKIEFVSATQCVATRWQVSKTSYSSSDLPASVVLDTSSALSLPVLNVDGNQYEQGGSVPSGPYTGTPYSDKRLWHAPSSTSYDGMSWAIPLVVVRRVPEESSYGIESTRLGTSGIYERFVYDVAPFADLGVSSVGLSYATESDSSALDEASPSGFLAGGRGDVSLGTPSLTYPKATVSVAGRKVKLEESTVTLSTAPTSGWRRDLIVLEFMEGSQPYRESPPSSDYFSSDFWLSRDDLRGPNPNLLFGQYRVYESTSSVLDEADSMTAAGFTMHPDFPGLWQRSVASHEAASAIYAIPVSLVHRRNTSSWDASISRNGAAGSPVPGADDPNNILEKDVVDLRHIILDKSNSSYILGESFDALLRGTLRTKFSEDPESTSVAGTQITSCDVIGSGVFSGYHELGPADGRRTIWSEAEEAILLSETIPDIGSTYTSYDGVFSWAVSGSTATLTIDVSPLVVGSSGVDLNIGQNVDQDKERAVGPARSLAVFFDSTSEDVTPLFPDSTSFSYALSGGRTTEVSCEYDITALAGSVVLQCWGRIPNRDSSSSTSLRASPDTVWGAEYVLTGPTPSAVASVGAIVRKVTRTISSNEISLSNSDPEFSDLGSNVQLLGVESFKIRGESNYDGSALPKLDTVTLSDGSSNPGYSNMVLSFVAGTSGTVDVVVMCYAGVGVNRWVEVNKGSKSISGLYQYTQVELGSTTTQYPSSILPSHMVPFSRVGLRPIGIGTKTSINKNSTQDSAAILYESVPGTGYVASYRSDLSTSYKVGALGIGPYSRVFSLHRGSSSPSDLMAVVVTCRPLLLDEELRIFYDYTPYQGIYPQDSDLSTRLHGTVEAVGPQLVTSSGTGGSSLAPREVVCSGQSERYLTDYSLVSLPAEDVGYPVFDVGDPGSSWELVRSLSKTSIVRSDLLLGPLSSHSDVSVAASSRLPFCTILSESRIAYQNLEIGPGMSVPLLMDFSGLATYMDSGWTQSEDDGYFYDLSEVSTPSYLYWEMPIGNLDGLLNITGVWADLSLDSGANDCYLHATIQHKPDSSGGWIDSLSFKSPLLTPDDLSSGGFPAERRNIPLFFDSDGPSVSSSRIRVRLHVEAAPASIKNLYVHGIRVRAITDSPLYDPLILPSSRRLRHSSFVISHGPTSVSVGHVYKPSSGFSSSASSLLQDGKEDYPGTGPRGATFGVSLSGTVFPLPNIHGFDPHSSLGLSLSLAGASLGVLGDHSAVSSSEGTLLSPPRYFSTAGSLGRLSSSSLAVDNWIISSGSNAYLAVATGLPSYPGTAVDAFYPKGRPLFRKS